MAIVLPFHIAERLPGFPSPAETRIVAPDLPEGRPQERMVVLFETLAEEVAAGERIVYAGDCMAPLGALAGLQRRDIDPFVVWLDAHGDFNTWETTPSGYIGGMPIAILVGREEPAIREGLGLRKLPEDRIVLADAREVDPREGVALSRSRIRIARVEEVVGLLPEDGPIYLHLDLDVVRPTEMPALRYPAAGGPTRAQVADCIGALAATGRLVCATIGCTFDPAHPQAAAATAATELLAARLQTG